MFMVHFFVLLAVALLAAGAFAILESASLPEFKAEGRPLYELLSPELSGPWPGGNDAWRTEVSERRTGKDALFDLGGSLVSVALALLALSWSMATSPTKAPRAPSSRIAVVALFILCYVGFFYATTLSVHWELKRHIDPPWVDHIRIQNVGIIGGLAMLLVPTAVILLWPVFRRIDLPQSLFLWRHDSPVASGLTTLFYDGLVALLLLAALLSWGDAGFVAILPLLGFAYLALCNQAMALAPRKARVGASAPALETNP